MVKETDTVSHTASTVEKRALSEDCASEHLP